MSMGTMVKHRISVVNVFGLAVWVCGWLAAGQSCGWWLVSRVAGHRVAGHWPHGQCGWYSCYWSLTSVAGRLGFRGKGSRWSLKKSF